MSFLIVASISPGAGRTALAALLAARAVRTGRGTGLARAFASTGDEPGATPDAADLRMLVPGAESADPEPVRAGEPSVDAARTAGRRLRTLGERSEVVIIEGLPGDAAANYALAEELDAAVILIARIDEDAVPAAREYGTCLAGVIVNALPRYREHALHMEIEPALEAAGVPYLGWLPEDRRLLALPVSTYAEHLGGAFLDGKEFGDRLIDNLLIGGMVLDWAPHYFGSKENAGVLVRGDRPDLQIAALQTEPPVRALLLTKGVEPVEYVYYEASQRQVPIVVVPADTHEAAALLETILERARFDHPEKLERVLQLADGRLDLEALDRALAAPVTG